MKVRETVSVDDNLSVVAVSAGTGTGSTTTTLGERLGSAVVGALADAGRQASLRHIHVREIAVDAVNATLTQVKSPALSEALAAVSSADALVFVTPVYNGSYSGLFKTFLDLLDLGAIAGVPVLLGATGGSVRHSLVIDRALVPLVYYQRAHAVPVPVFVATSEWGSGGSSISARIDDAAIATAAAVLGSPRKPKRDPFEDVTDFAELLRGMPD